MSTRTALRVMVLLTVLVLALFGNVPSGDAAPAQAAPVIRCDGGHAMTLERTVTGVTCNFLQRCNTTWLEKHQGQYYTILLTWAGKRKIQDNDTVELTVCLMPGGGEARAKLVSVSR